MIDSAVKQIVRSKKDEPEELEKLKSRLHAYKLWKEKGKLFQPGQQNVKAGDKIDVRDTEEIWCSGKIELKISTINRLPLLYIHYEVSFWCHHHYYQGWNRKYDEYIYVNSDRLAPSGTYTNRQDIPRYSMNPYSNLMQASIVENAAAVQPIQPVPEADQQEIPPQADLAQAAEVQAEIAPAQQLDESDQSEDDEDELVEEDAHVDEARESDNVDNRAPEIASLTQQIQDMTRMQLSIQQGIDEINNTRQNLTRLTNEFDRLRDSLRLPPPLPVNNQEEVSSLMDEPAVIE